MRKFLSTLTILAAVYIALSAQIIINNPPSAGGSFSSICSGSSNTQVLFNDSSACAGDSGLTYNKTTDSLSLLGRLTSATATIANLIYPTSDGSNGYVLTTNGSGTLSFQPSGGTFLPTNISGLQLWLDASQIVGLVNNDPVATWDDESGNNYDFTQGTSVNRPVYKTSPTRVSFAPGDPQFLSSTALGLRNVLASTDGFTLAMVANLHGGANDAIFGTASVSDTYLSLVSNATVTTIDFNTFNPPTVLTQYEAGNIGPGLTSFVLVNNSQLVGIKGATIIPNVAGQMPTGMPSAGAGVFLPTDNNQLNPGNLDVMELIIYNTVINAQQGRQILEYFSVKWGSL